MSSASKNAKVFAKTNGLCWYCGTQLSPAIMTKDHVLPISRGGQSTVDNQVPACLNCNADKANLTLEEYRFIKRLRAIRSDCPTMPLAIVKWLMENVSGVIFSSAQLDVFPPDFYGEKL